MGNAPNCCCRKNHFTPVIYPPPSCCQTGRLCQAKTPTSKAMEASAMKLKNQLSARVIGWLPRRASDPSLNAGVTYSGERTRPAEVAAYGTGGGRSVGEPCWLRRH